MCDSAPSVACPRNQSSLSRVYACEAANTAQRTCQVHAHRGWCRTCWRRRHRAAARTRQRAARPRQSPPALPRCCPCRSCSRGGNPARIHGNSDCQSENTRRALMRKIQAERAAVVVKRTADCGRTSRLELLGDAAAASSCLCLTTASADCRLVGCALAGRTLTPLDTPADPALRLLSPPPAAALQAGEGAGAGAGTGGSIRSRSPSSALALSCPPSSSLG